MVTVIKKPATVADLYKVADGGKAELVKGELRLMAPTGGDPSLSGGNIFVSLRQYVLDGRPGIAVPDNAGFIVDLPDRQSFSPDVAFFIGERPGMKFFQGAPVFAVESEARTTTAPPPNARWPPSAPTTLPQGRSSSGTSISSVMTPSGSIAQPTPKGQRSTVAAKLPRPSPPSLSGQCP